MALLDSYTFEAKKIVYYSVTVGANNKTEAKRIASDFEHCQHYEEVERCDGFEYKVGKLNLTPSFSPGIYTVGDGKDLGSPLEFKSEVQLSIDLLPGSKLGYSQSHISNADLGDKNPGADSYMFNFMKSF